MKFKFSSFWLITIGLVIVKLTIHFLSSTVYELHRDEMLYFALGNNLDFGYASTPPLIGILAFISRILFGYSEFGIKLFPALIGAVSIVIISLMVKEFGGRKLAVLIAGVGFLTTGAFLRSNSLFQPVSFNQFFWLLSAYLVIKMVNTNNSKLWLWIGLVFGLAFLNKYSIVFFAFAIIVSLIISPHRKIILSKHFLWGILIGFLIILPNLIWQLNHNWPVVHHMAELQKHQLVNNTIYKFLLDQIISCAGSGFIWLFGLFVILFVPAEKKYRFIGYTFLLVLLIILIGRGKSYYTLGAYTMLLAAGGCAMERYLTKKLVFINYIVIIAAIITSIVFLPLELPIASFEIVMKYTNPETGIQPQRWEDGKTHPLPQDYADMTGWKELTKIVSDAYNMLDSCEKEKCTIYTENYGQAGAIEFYGHQYGLPKPISFHDSYLLWVPDTIGNGPFIYVSDKVGDMDDFFDNYPEIGKVNNEYFRENGLMVLLCTNPKKQWKSFYSQKTQELKSIYR